MNRMELRAKPDDARELVTIEFWMNGTPLGHIHLDAGSLEQHIHDLGKHRAALNDQVPRELDPGSRLEAIYDPVWRTAAVDSDGQHGIVLALRHPGLGWLSFLLPFNEAANLGDWLVGHAKPSDGGSSSASG